MKRFSPTKKQLHTWASARAHDPVKWLWFKSHHVPRPKPYLHRETERVFFASMADLIHAKVSRRSFR